MSNDRPPSDPRVTGLHAPRAQSRLPPKLYFRIGEVASLVGVEPHVLRYWEREFRTIRPTKSAKGQRVYSRRDVENLMRVRELLYQEGFTIAGAKKKLERNALRRPEPEHRDSPQPSQDGDARAESQAQADATQHAKEAEKQAERDAIAAASREASQKIRATLTEMKAEVEAFLAELG